MRSVEEYRAMIDDRYHELLEMTHKGKDVDLAIMQAYTHLLADERELDPMEFKRYVNSWLSNMRSQKSETKRAKLL